MVYLVFSQHIMEHLTILLKVHKKLSTALMLRALYKTDGWVWASWTVLFTKPAITDAVTEVRCRFVWVKTHSHPLNSLCLKEKSEKQQCAITRQHTLNMIYECNCAIWIRCHGTLLLITDLQGKKTSLTPACTTNRRWVTLLSGEKLYLQQTSQREELGSE